MENIQKESKPKNTYHRERYMKNREKLIAYQKQWNAINNYRSPDKILRQRQYNKEYYQKNKHRWNERVADKPVTQRPQHNSSKYEIFNNSPNKKELSFFISF